MKPIVIEGPDNSGKSTLVLALAKDLKAVVINSQVVPPPDQYWVEDYVKWYSGSSRLNRPIIIDRHPVISDPIYGRLLRGRTVLTDDYCRNVRSTLFVVYCRPPVSNIRDLGSRPQMAGVREHIDRLIAEYDSVMANPHQFAGFLRYDWTRGAYRYFLSTIRRVLDNEH